MARWTMADVEALKKKPEKPKKEKVRLYAPAFEDTSELERETQAAIVKVLRQLGLLFYHINNGADIGAIGGAIAQGQGVVEGVPDICVAEPFDLDGTVYHSLYIEVKRPKGGTVGAEQIAWRNALRARGFWVISGIGGAGLVIDFLCQTYGARVAHDLPKGCK